MSNHVVLMMTNDGRVESPFCSVVVRCEKNLIAFDRGVVVWVATDNELEESERCT
jgi:hypothetical protein